MNLGPQNLAPGLRKAAIIITAGLGVVFALMMKAGAFKGDSALAVFAVAVAIFVVCLGVIIALDSNRVRDASMPNPLHPANRPPPHD